MKLFRPQQTLYLHSERFLDPLKYFERPSIHKTTMEYLLSKCPKKGLWNSLSRPCVHRRTLKDVSIHRKLLKGLLSIEQLWRVYFRNILCTLQAFERSCAHGRPLVVYCMLYIEEDIPSVFIGSLPFRRIFAPTRPPLKEFLFFWPILVFWKKL